MGLFIIVAILCVIAIFWFIIIKKKSSQGPEMTLAGLSDEERDLYNIAMQPENAVQTFIYALTTCTHCKRTLKLLNENNIPFSVIYIDSYPKVLHDLLSEKMREYNPRGSFPTIYLTTGQIITGYRESAIREALINDSNSTS